MATQETQVVGRWATRWEMGAQKYGIYLVGVWLSPLYMGQDGEEAQRGLAQINRARAGLELPQIVAR